jgi:type IV pilus assembly protein PilF
MNSLKPIGLLKILATLVTASVLLFGTGCMSVSETSVDGREIDTNKAADEHIKAAMTYLSSGQLGAAQRHLNRALELDPKSIPAHNAMAMSYSMTGEFELAEKSYQDLLDIDPDYSPARNNYAGMLFKLGRTDEACDEWQEVVADGSYERRSGAYYNLGQCRIVQQRYDQAEQAFERSVALDRNASAGYLELAKLYYGKGEYAKSQTLYSEYRSLRGRPTPTSLLLGIKLAVESGDRDAQASQALALKSLFPASPEYLEYQRRARNQ